MWCLPCLLYLCNPVQCKGACLSWSVFIICRHSPFFKAAAYSFLPFPQPTTYRRSSDFVNDYDDFEAKFVKFEKFALLYKIILFLSIPHYVFILYNIYLCISLCIGFCIKKKCPKFKKKRYVWQISKNQKEKRLRRVKFSTVGVKRRLDF